MDAEEIAKLNDTKDLRVIIKSLDFLGRGGTPEHFIGETFKVKRITPEANGYTNVYYDASRFGPNFKGGWFAPLHCVVLLRGDDDYERILPKKRMPKRSW